MDLEYPYDLDDFSPYTRALLGTLRGGDARPDPRSELLALIADDLPRDAAALLHTLAHHVGAGSLAFGDEVAWVDPERDVRAMFEEAGLDEELDGWFDPREGALVGAAEDGSAALGIRWSDGDVRVFLVEPGEGELRDLGTLDDYFEDLFEVAEEDGKPIPAGLAALRSLASEAAG